MHSGGQRDVNRTIECIRSAAPARALAAGRIIVQWYLPLLFNREPIWLLRDIRSPASKSRGFVGTTAKKGLSRTLKMAARSDNQTSRTPEDRI